MKINWKSMLTMAGAVVVGVMVHRFVMKALNIESATDSII